MQDKLETAFTDWVIALWTDSPILAVCVALTGFTLVWGLAEKTGLILSWLPKRKELTEALQTTTVGAEGKTLVDVGVKYQHRLTRIAKGDGWGSASINSAQNLLGRLYDATPLHPQALLKALNYAAVYSLLFWLLPWLAGGTGKLGGAALLPDNMAFFQRLLLLTPILPMLIYFVLKKHWGLTGWKDFVALIGAGAFAVAGAVAGAVAYINDLSIETTLNHYQAQQRTLALNTRLKYASRLLAPYIVLLVLTSATPYWLPLLTLVRENWAAANSPSFTLLFFLGWLPVLNGLFDFLSVSLTQYFLTRMQEQRWTLLWWGIDVLTALLLVFGLYGLVIFLLFAMQWLGWGVDPHAIIQQFLNDPRSSLWLLLLAMTNILPTLLHWGLGLAGLWADFLGPNARHAQAWAQKVLNGQPLGKVDAGDFADYLLFGQRGFNGVLALCLMSWAVWIFSWLLPQGLAWFLSL